MSDKPSDTTQPSDQPDAAKQKPESDRISPQTDRESRLADALKRNIRRRKASHTIREKD